MVSPHVNLDRNPPTVIVALNDVQFIEGLCDCFAEQGWKCLVAQDGSEVRRCARLSRAELIICATDLPDESGWLVTAKLQREFPGVRVILVGEKSPRGRALAAYVGAVDLVDEADGVEAVVEGVFGLSATKVA